MGQPFIERAAPSGDAPPYCTECGGSLSEVGPREVNGKCAECAHEAGEAGANVREILCRVFDDGADAGMTEWRAWYKPTEWLHWSRALGAFIRLRAAGESRTHAAPGSRPDSQPAPLDVQRAYMAHPVAESSKGATQTPFADEAHRQAYEAGIVGWPHGDAAQDHGSTDGGSERRSAPEQAKPGDSSSVQPSAR